MRINTIYIIAIHIIIIGFIECTVSKNSEKNSNDTKNDTLPKSGSSTSPYSIVITQTDNTTIEVIGKGNSQHPIVETTDGYTIIRNDQKIYEYALKGSNGELKPSGIKANDPDKRSHEEEEFLENLTKHLN